MGSSSRVSFTDSVLRLSGIFFCVYIGIKK